MIADVRNRSGLEANPFRTDADITRYINESGYDFYGRVGVDNPHAMHLYKEDTISVVDGTSLYDVPADCYRVYAFRVTIDGYRIDIPSADWDDIDIETDDDGWGYFGNRPLHRMMGWRAGARVPQVKFIPTPTQSYTVTVHYIPQLIFVDTDIPGRIAELSAGATHAMESEWGFERYLVLDASIKVRRDQEEDVRDLLQEREELYDRINREMASRVVTKPPRIRDVFMDRDWNYGRYRYRRRHLW